MRITWVGHSTVLLEADGARLLTDPLLRPRVGHLRRVGGPVPSIGPLTVRGTHADHPARRLPFGAETPALGYLVEGSQRVYFAGDTDIFDGMRELAHALDAALLPIDGWGPRLGPGHLDPQRAAEALQLLRPRLAVPIHWGTYRRLGLSRDSSTLREPAARFERLAAELAPDVEVRLLAPGDRLELQSREEARL